MDEFWRRKVYTLDDSSGMCIECTTRAPMAKTGSAVADEDEEDKDTEGSSWVENPTVENPRVPWDEVDVGAVVKIKGRVGEFREQRQVEVIKIEVLGSTDEEVKCWGDMEKFKREILDVPWVVSKKQEMDCKREAEEEAKKERKGDGKKKGVGNRVEELKRRSRGDGSRGKPDIRKRKSRGQEDKRRRAEASHRGGIPERKQRTSVDDQNAALHQLKREQREQERKNRERREAHEGKPRRKDGAGNGLDPADKSNLPSLAIRRRAAGKYDALGI